MTDHDLTTFAIRHSDSIEAPTYGDTMLETNEHLYIANLLRVIELPEIGKEVRERILQEIRAYTFKYSTPTTT
jgi:hypothetical protein